VNDQTQLEKIILQDYILVTAKSTGFKVIPLFFSVPVQSPINNFNVLMTNTTSSWQSRAHFVANALKPPSWIINNGDLHHVISNLSNLLFHILYIGSNDIIIKDRSGLSITHTSSTSLKTPQTNFILNNILYVLSMKNNIILISQFCTLI
jgi:hypothetical protein